VVYRPGYGFLPAVPSVQLFLFTDGMPPLPVPTPPGVFMSRLVRELPMDVMPSSACLCAVAVHCTVFVPPNALVPFSSLGSRPTAVDTFSTYLLPVLCKMVLVDVFYRDYHSTIRDVFSRMDYTLHLGYSGQTPFGLCDGSGLRTTYRHYHAPYPTNAFFALVIVPATTPGPATDV